MLDWWEKNFATCELGDRRLNERAMSIGYALSLGFGKALSEIFNLATVLKRDAQMAATILRWYSYRWRVEEYHKILKSGCQVERYRLAGDGMKTLLGFLSVIAMELLQLTYLHRTQPTAAAIEVLNPLQLQVLSAKSSNLPKVLTVSWAVEA